MWFVCMRLLASAHRCRGSRAEASAAYAQVIFFCRLSAYSHTTPQFGTELNAVRGQNYHRARSWCGMV